jgi:hypothetical protein
MTAVDHVNLSRHRLGVEETSRKGPTESLTRESDFNDSSHFDLEHSLHF